MIQVKIRNYRSVERADLDLEGIVLLAGDVESGKSSVCSAIGAVLTQTAIGWPDLKKKDAHALIRDTADQGSIAAGDTEADWETEITYPRAQVKSSGLPPGVHPVAAGLLRYTDLSLDRRTELLSACLPGDVTLEDCYEFGEEIGLDRKIVDAAWERIGKSGWDGALAAAEEKTPEFRLKYRETTGTVWGSDKGAKWTPDGWDPELLKRTPEDLQKVAEQADADYQAAMREDALDAAELERLQALAGELPARRERYQAAVSGVAAAEAALEARQNEREALPAAAAGISRHNCPHCGAEVEVQVTGTTARGRKQSVTLSAPRADNDAATQQAIADAERALGQAERALDEAKTERDDAQAAVEGAEAAADNLRNRSEGKSGPAIADVLAIREAAARNVDMLARVLRARKCHAAILANLGLRKMLDMKGVRTTVMGRRVKRFNEEILAPLVAKTATSRGAWPAVELHPDMTATWGGRPWSLCSASAQWRVNAVLAVGFAVAAAQPVAVLDGADILPPWALNALVSMLRSADVVAVVGLTATDPQKLPKLQRAGLGRVYWLGGGENIARDFVEIHG